LSEALKDDRLGLTLRGYDLVPNTALETVIAVYTPQVVETILKESPEIVEKWLKELDSEYRKRRERCEFENDAVACFNLSFYEEFEKHYKSWHDGGMISIRLPHNMVVNVSKMPLFSVAVADSSAPSPHACERCLAVFADISRLEEHYERIHKPETGKAQKYVIEARSDADEHYSKNPMWW
jgi:hypothetical protein